MKTRRQRDKERRKCSDGTEISVGDKVAAQYDGPPYFLAVVTRLPPVSDRVTVRFLDDHIETTIKVDGVTSNLDLAVTNVDEFLSDYRKDCKLKTKNQQESIATDQSPVPDALATIPSTLTVDTKMKSDALATVPRALTAEAGTIPDALSTVSKTPTPDTEIIFAALATAPRTLTADAEMTSDALLTIPGALITNSETMPAVLATAPSTLTPDAAILSAALSTPPRTPILDGLTISAKSTTVPWCLPLGKPMASVSSAMPKSPMSDKEKVPAASFTPTYSDAGFASFPNVTAITGLNEVADIIAGSSDEEEHTLNDEIDLDNCHVDTAFLPNLSYARKETCVPARCVSSPISLECNTESVMSWELFDSDVSDGHRDTAEDELSDVAKSTYQINFERMSGDVFDSDDDTDNEIVGGPVRVLKESKLVTDDMLIPDGKIPTRGGISMAIDSSAKTLYTAAGILKTVPSSTTSDISTAAFSPTSSVAIPLLTDASSSLCYNDAGVHNTVSECDSELYDSDNHPEYSLSSSSDEDDDYEEEEKRKKKTTRVLPDDTAASLDDGVTSHTSFPAIVSTTTDVDNTLPAALSPTNQTPTAISPTVDSVVTATSHKNAITICPITRRKQNPKQRVYDKRYFCLYCNLPQAKLPRHLTSVHSKEFEVIRYMSCSDKLIKTQLITKLRNQGNHIHNQKVYKSGKGELMVAYRPEREEENKVGSYIPCVDCFGYYRKGDMWKHVKRCILRQKDSSPQKRKRKNHVAQGRLLITPRADTSAKLHEVLSTMTSDHVSIVVRNDPLLLKFGEHLVLKHGHDRNRYGYIRNVLRELGRLMVEIKGICPRAKALQEFIDVGNFSIVVQAARIVTGFNTETNRLKIPSLAIKLGASLNKCATILQSEALGRYDDATVTKARNFKEQMSFKWDIEFSINALRTLREDRKNTIKLLPLSSDVKKLSQYLKTEISNHRVELGKTTDMFIYNQLQKKLLTLIILFNRKRSGEVSRMTLQDYYGVNQPSNNITDLGLSDLEQALLKSLTRIEITGKRGRTVPVLLTSLMSESLSQLISLRETFKINPKNNYVFAQVSGGLGCISGCDVLREYSVECGAIRPKALRSTNLRKEIAIMTQVVNLRDNELDILATFMGHDINTHREYYRLPEETTQVAKVAKILLALEEGKMGKCAGKSLDEIPVDLEEELEVSDDDKESVIMEDTLSEPSATHEEYCQNGIQSKARGTVDINDRKRNRHRVLSSSQTSGGVTVTKQNRRPWTEEEKSAVFSHFQKNVLLKTTPGKRDIEKFLELFPGIKREWRNIKYKVRDFIIKQK